MKIGHKSQTAAPEPGLSICLYHLHLCCPYSVAAGVKQNPRAAGWCWSVDPVALWCLPHL